MLWKVSPTCSGGLGDGDVLQGTGVLCADKLHSYRERCN